MRRLRGDRAARWGHRALPAVATSATLPPIPFPPFFLIPPQDVYYTIKTVAKQFQKGVVDMSCLTVRDLSSRTLSSLKMRAKSNHRSLNGEILFIFEWVADHGLKPPPPIEGMADSAVARQKSEMDSLIGTWGDSRTSGEIIDDIYGARTRGAAMKLLDTDTCIGLLKGDDAVVASWRAWRRSARRTRPRRAPRSCRA